MGKLIETEFKPFVDDPFYDKPLYEPKSYRDGAEGFIWWCEDKVYVEIYPEGEDISVWVRIKDLPKEPNPRTGRSYWDMWVAQKRIVRQALEMVDGRFIYNLIVFCWQRGEGKSLLACLIQLWKFFNWTGQSIMLGANSKDQVKFVHYDIMRDIINNSPQLLSVVGPRNIQEKEIRIKNNKGNVVSLIRSISSFSGIVSNITGFTFSEIFDMKNPKFYTQLYGSIRNIPNAFGVIDSTVSEKSHLLYNKLYKGWNEKKTQKLFFSYRFARLGIPDEYWNPNMDEAQLNDYKYSFPFGEFERYFQNLWEAGSMNIFSEEQIEEVGYFGVNNLMLNHSEIQNEIQKKKKILNQKEDLEDKGLYQASLDLDSSVEQIKNGFTTVDKVCSFKSDYKLNEMISVDVLNQIGDLLETDWVILSGIDFGNPYATKSSARSILSIIAKGLVGSKKNALKYLDEESPKYFYLQLYLANLTGHSLPEAKDILEEGHSEYDGIDVLCLETYGAGDLEIWCDDRDIEFKPIYPTYGRQKEGFKEYYLAVEDGRYKATTILVPGYKEDDLLREEMGKLQHETKPGKDMGWFGSPEKDNLRGVQDDSQFATCWTIYGGIKLNVSDFRERKGSGLDLFGSFIPNKNLTGSY